jgi:hypothetical protein
MKLNKTGAAQSTFVVGVSVVTLVVLAVCIILFITHKIDQREQDKRMSQEIAEAGLTEALEIIKTNPAWNEGFINVKSREGFYSVAINQVNDSIFKAVSTGIDNSAKTVIVCTYKLEKADGQVRPKTLNWEYQ